MEWNVWQYGMKEKLPRPEENSFLFYVWLA
jgi:hypothetical protein